jgi:hypothetical protein
MSPNEFYPSLRSYKEAERGTKDSLLSTLHLSEHGNDGFIRLPNLQTRL